MFSAQPERPQYRQPSVTPERLQFLGEQQDFQPMFASILQKEPQIDTMQRISAIGYMLNGEFHRWGGHRSKTGFEEKIWRAQIEAGIAVPAIMLKEEAVDLEYQAKKLNEWLDIGNENLSSQLLRRQPPGMHGNLATVSKYQRHCGSPILASIGSCHRMNPFDYGLWNIFFDKLARLSHN
jgi:hypothetical protein